MSSVAIKRLVTENVTFAFYFSLSKFLLQNTSKGRGNKKFRRIWKKLNCIVVWITSLLNSIRHVVPDSNSRYLQVSRDHILNLEKFLLQKIWCRLAMHLYLPLPFSSTSCFRWRMDAEGADAVQQEWSLLGVQCFPLFRWLPQLSNKYAGPMFFRC